MYFRYFYVNCKKKLKFRIIDKNKISSCVPSDILSALRNERVRVTNNWSLLDEK